MRQHHISFRHAWDGVITGLKTQPNFRIHLALSSLAILAGFALHISRLEWLVVLFVIAVGLSIELINTSIEFTVDLLTDQYHLLAKYAKDTAAAAMLVYAVFSLLLAMIIFIPRIWPLF